MIEPGHKILSINRQCELLGLPRASLYYEAAPIDQLNVSLINFLDEQHTKYPFYGYRKLTCEANKVGYAVNHKRIQRLLEQMGVQAVYTRKKPNLSSPGHKVFPYLLGNIVAQYPNHIWSVDITYIRMRLGFMYLVAIMDWYSRYVLSWRLSNSMEVSFCVEALEAALAQAIPEIHNSDQGSQFGSEQYTSKLLSNNIKISMDGKGRAFDNIFIERLWRSVKYEHVYMHDYVDGFDAREKLTEYFNFYNLIRPHQSLRNRTPQEVYLIN